MKKNIVGYVCFGEVNTPIERLQMKHDEALEALKAKVDGVVDGGLVIDDPAYETADAAYAKLEGLDLDCLVVCVAGWIPTHAVIRVTDHFRHVPMILWGFYLFSIYLYLIYYISRISFYSYFIYC